MQWVLDRLSPSILFALLSVLVLGTAWAAIYLNLYELWVLPFGGLFAIFSIFNFRKLYFFLLASISFSMEFTITSSLSLDTPSEPLMIALLLGGIYYAFSNPTRFEKSFFFHPLTLALSLHLIWMTVTLFFAQHFIVSLKFMLAKSWYIAAFFLATFFLIRKQSDFKKWLAYLLVPLTVIIAIITVHHATLAFSFEEVNKSLQPFFRNHVTYGLLLALMLPYAWIAKDWGKRGSMLQSGIWLAIILILVGIFVSYCRAAYISVLLIPIGYFVFKYRWSKPLIFISLLLTTVVVLYMLTDNNFVEFAPNMNETIHHKSFDKHLEATVDFTDMSIMERLFRWVAGVKMIGQSPLVGFGPGNFVFVYHEYASTAFETWVSYHTEEYSTAHNYFILTGAEQGIPGLLIVLFLFCSIFIVGERVYHETQDPFNKKILMAVLICQLMIVINNLMGDLIEAPETGSFFFMNIAFIIYFDLLNQKKIKNDELTQPTL